MHGELCTGLSQDYRQVLPARAQVRLPHLFHRSSINTTSKYEHYGIGNSVPLRPKMRSLLANQDGVGSLQEAQW